MKVFLWCLLFVKFFFFNCIPGQIGSIISAIKPAVEIAKARYGYSVESAVKANVMEQIKIINSSPVITQLVQEKKLKIVGAYYDLELGKVNLIT